MSSSCVQIQFKINNQETKRLKINNEEFKKLNEFWSKLCEDLRQNLDENGAFDDAINISNALMNKLLASFKNKEIFDNFIQNAQYRDSLVARIRKINFKTHEEFSRFVIFFEKLSEKQQKIFLDFLETIYDKNLSLANKDSNNSFASAEYIKMIIDIFSEKYKNIDSFLDKLIQIIQKNGIPINLGIEEEIELNKIIDKKTFEKFFEFFLKDYSEQELEEIAKQDLEKFLNSDDFKNKKDIEGQEYLVDIQDENKKQEVRSKKKEITSCMKKKAQIIKTFFEKEFDEKRNILENETSKINDKKNEKAEITVIPNHKGNKSEKSQLQEINDETTKKPDTPHDSKKKNPNHMKALITGFALISVDALLLGVLAKKGLPNLFENRMINIGLIICSSMLLIVAEALIVKKVYNLEIKNIDNLESNKAL